MPDEYQLLLSQKNQLFTAITTLGFEPSQFEWAEAYFPTLLHKGTRYYFKFEMQQRARYSEYSPGSQVLVEYDSHRTWQEQVLVFIKWLGFLKREIKQPDLWRQVTDNLVDTELNLDVENTPFSNRDIEIIRSGINQVRTYLSSQDELHENIMIINQKLDYLIDATGRLGKKDWLLLCMGAIISLVMALALDSEKANTIWGIIKGTLNGVSLLLK